MFYCVVVYQGPFLCIVSFAGMCSVFWLFQYLPSDWLERLLRKPNCGKGIVSKKPKPQSVYHFLGLFYCFTIQLYGCVVSLPYMIYIVLLWHDIAGLCC